MGPGRRLLGGGDRAAGEPLRCGLDERAPRMAATWSCDPAAAAHGQPRPAPAFGDQRVLDAGPSGAAFPFQTPPDGQPTLNVMGSSDITLPSAMLKAANRLVMPCRQ